MSEKLDNATEIIEGKVIAQNAFKSNEHIYTLNTIEVFKAVKGTATKGQLIEIITSGGLLDDYHETWTHMPSLYIGQHSFFFLRPSAQSMYKDLNRANTFEIFSGVQGIYTFSKDISRTLHSELEGYRDIETFYHKIGMAGYEDYISPEENINERSLTDDTCIVYNLRPVGNTYSDTTESGERRINIDIDLYIKVTAGGFRLYEANLETYYNTAMFGTNVVANGKITAVKSTAFNSNYNLILTDVTSDKIKISLIGTSLVANTLQMVDTAYKYVARFTLQISGWDGNSPLEWDELTVDNDKYSEEGTNVIRNFGCEEFKIGETNAAPEIEDFQPKIVASGVGLESENAESGIIIITGSNFSQPQNGDKKPSDYRVKFETYDGSWIAPLEGDYISWQDDEIIVKVPSIGYINNSDDIIQDENDQIAITGKIRVCKDGLFNCGQFDTSDEELYIKYSANNDFAVNTEGDKESLQMLLRNLKEDGGYTIRFYPSFRQDWMAVDAFKRALSTWRCSTKINYSVDLDNSPSSNPGFGIVQYAPLPVGTETTTARTSFTSPTCPDNTFFYESSFLIKFNDELEWHKGVDMPTLSTEFDLESSALHELGHALGLYHNFNTGSVMKHPKMEKYRRILHNDDLSGGIHIAKLSSETIANSCNGSPMILIDENDCQYLSILDEQTPNQITIYPNPTIGEVNIIQNSTLCNCKVEISNSAGIIISNFALPDDEIIDISSYSVGIYILRIINLKTGHSHSIKVIKL